MMNKKIALAIALALSTAALQADLFSPVERTVEGFGEGVSQGWDDAGLVGVAVEAPVETVEGAFEGISELPEPRDRRLFGRDKKEEKTNDDDALGAPADNNDNDADINMNLDTANEVAKKEQEEKAKQAEQKAKEQKEKKGTSEEFNQALKEFFSE